MGEGDGSAGLQPIDPAHDAAAAAAAREPSTSTAVVSRPSCRTPSAAFRASELCACFLFWFFTPSPFGFSVFSLRYVRCIVSPDRARNRSQTARPAVPEIYFDFFYDLFCFFFRFFQAERVPRLHVVCGEKRPEKSKCFLVTFHCCSFIITFDGSHHVWHGGIITARSIRSHADPSNSSDSRSRSAPDDGCCRRGVS